MTSFSQLHLSRNSCSRRSLDQINLHFLALHTRWLIKKGEKCEKLSRFYVGMENFTFREIHVGEKSKRKSDLKLTLNTQLNWNSISLDFFSPCHEYTWLPVFLSTWSFSFSFLLSSKLNPLSLLKLAKEYLFFGEYFCPTYFSYVEK